MELLLVNLDERALASGAAWYVVPVAGPGLAPPWQEADSWEWGKGLVFRLFQFDRFQTNSDFFFGGILLIFAWMFFSFSAQFFTFLMLLSFLTFHHHLSLICLYLPSVSLYPFPVHYETNGNPHTVAFPFPWKQNIHCFFLKSLGHCLINSAPQFLRIYLFAVITQSTSKCLSESSNTQHLPEEH